uniref:Uncharacterized protein n=1 Tax=Romanomermis culicivorax TaxID=13658 RepID=A0A915HZX9_ROMCU
CEPCCRVHPFGGRIKIDCPLYKSSGNKLVSIIRAHYDMCDEPYMNIRTGIINFMREIPNTFKNYLLWTIHPALTQERQESQDAHKIADMYNTMQIFLQNMFH